MKYFRPVLITVFWGTLAASASLASTALAGGADRFDERMQPVLASYLKIQEALAADSTNGVQAAARSIAQDAVKLDAESVTGEHAAHYRDLPTQLKHAGEAVSRASSLEATREAFKQLSKPMAMWATMSQRPGVDVVFCSTAKSSWVQEHGAVRNPYYGNSMPTCGEVVSGAGHSIGPMKHARHGGT